MKRIAILFLTILLVKIYCSSQSISKSNPQDSIVSITSSQLKKTNLIFVEHKKLLKENYLLKDQIYNYQLSIDNFKEIDSLRLEQINNYQEMSDLYSLQIKDLNTSLKRKERAITYWKIGGITISTGLALFLLLK